MESLYRIRRSSTTSYLRIRTCNSSPAPTLKTFVILLTKFGLAQSGHAKREAVHLSTDLAESEPVQVVIVGSGPAGLLNAITARSFDLSVTVVEKRSDFTRDVWMDLYGPPFAQSLPTVESWVILLLTDLQGLGHQEIEFQTHPGIDYAKTFRLQILQRFLSKVAVTVGVNFVQAQYSGWCKGKA